MVLRGTTKNPRCLVKSVATFASKQMMRICTGSRIG